MSAKIDEKDVELNGETDDEDMEDGEKGVDDESPQVPNIRDPSQPTVEEHPEHMTTHRPYRSWCKFCVMGRGVKSQHRRSDAQDDLEGVHEWIMGSSGEEFEEQVSSVDDVGNAGSKKRNRVPQGRKESSEIHRPTGAQQSHAQVRQRAGD